MVWKMLMQGVGCVCGRLGKMGFGLFGFVSFSDSGLFDYRVRIWDCNRYAIKLEHTYRDWLENSLKYLKSFGRAEWTVSSA